MRFKLRVLPRATRDFTVEANSQEEAKNKLYQKSWKCKYRGIELEILEMELTK